MYKVTHELYLHITYELFNLVLVKNKVLRTANSRTHVDFVIFSLIIRSNAELSTVFRIWASRPLKNPSRPSVFHMVLSALKNVFLDFILASSCSSSFDSADCITTLHLFKFRKFDNQITSFQYNRKNDLHLYGKYVLKSENYEIYVLKKGINNSRYSTYD